MFQPAAARAWAVARPMPRFEPAPVTTAVLSETDMVFSFVGERCQTVGGVGSTEAVSPPSSALTLLTMASVDRP